MSSTAAENSVPFELWDTRGRQHNLMYMVKFSVPVLDSGLVAHDF